MKVRWKDQNKLKWTIRIKKTLINKKKNVNKAVVEMHKSNSAKNGLK